MIDRKELAPWIAIVLVLGFLIGAGYYFVGKPPVESAGGGRVLSKEAAIQAELAIQEGKDKRNRQNAGKIFCEILKTPPETLVVTAILKGDSYSALRAAKIWEMADPGNPISRSLLEAFKRTLTCGTESCSVRLTEYKSSQDFRLWLAALKIKYPDNPNVILMTIEDIEDSKTFSKAIKSKHADLGFNFGVELCASWIEDDTTARLRNDWKNTRSTPAALRLAQRLTCSNDNFRSTSREMEEALTVLEAAVKTSPATDLESIRDAFIWAKVNTSE